MSGAAIHLCVQSYAPIRSTGHLDVAESPSTLVFGWIAWAVASRLPSLGPIRWGFGT
jgi:hypothetical protein